MFKSITKLDYLLRETLLGLRRGGWMNWAAISTVTVLLFLFGMSLQTSWQLEKLLNQFGSQVEVSVYLDPVTRAETVKPVIANLPEVAAVESITKEQAWATLVRELGSSDIDGATQQLGSNPLVDELKVRARKVEVMPVLATQLAQLPGVKEVQYVDQAVKRLAQLHGGLKWVSLMIVSTLTLTSIAVIATTIRLIVMARQREIEIMQLVGATRAWIYLPFILQGTGFGLAGAAIAWSLISTTQHFLGKLLASQPEFIQFLTRNLALSLTQGYLLPLILLSFGATVGLMGSLFAVRRFARG